MISERFKKTVLRTLKLENCEFSDTMEANQVPGWDSLNHAFVIAALEKEYGIRLRNLEVLNCENLGDLQKLIDSKF